MGIEEKMRNLSPADRRCPPCGQKVSPLRAEGVPLAGREMFLPDAPGVYMMKDEGGNILYVGKARSLRKRVLSYFRRSAGHGARIAAMVSKVEDIDFIQTATEPEALIYEAHLAYLHKPKYNVQLKDDKAYPLLKLTVHEEFPRLIITRRIPLPEFHGLRPRVNGGEGRRPTSKQAGRGAPGKPDGALYFGPYTSSNLLRSALSIMRRAFPLRTCKKLPKKTCLMFDIDQCLGPCEGRVNKRRYGEVVKELLLFLRGKRDKLIEQLARKMARASENRKYEEAARLRDRIKALTLVVEGPRRIRVSEQLAALQEALDLPNPPLRIDAFDISNIFGNPLGYRWAVGSMVQFTDLPARGAQAGNGGAPNKSNYRRFKIESVEGIDDYKMMREVIFRRYSRCKEERLMLPDLIIVDGGRGHLSIALEELEKLGLGFIPVIAIAKEYERIYTTSKTNPLVLPPTSPALHLVQRIRNEAHRFAVSYHRGLRLKSVRKSELDAIPGIGEKRKSALLRHFGTVNAIKRAAAEELAAAPAMNKRAAQAVYRYFYGHDKPK